MKKSIIRLTYALAVIILMATGIVQRASAGEIRYTLDLSSVDLHIEPVKSPDGHVYSRIISSEGIHEIGDIGTPIIPAKVINFLVPTYSNNFSVEIGKKKIGGSMKFLLEPFPRQDYTVTFNSNKKDFTSLQETKSDSHCNPKAAIFHEQFVNGDAHVISVIVPLLQYSNDYKTADVYESFELNIHYNECSIDQMTIHPISGKASVLDINLAEYVVNAPKNSQTVESNNSLSTIVSPQYVILTPENLRESILPLERLKRQNGYTVYVATVENILADSRYDIVQKDTAFDKESKIRNWLKYKKEEVGTFKLLIIGNHKTSAPIRKFMHHNYSPDKPEDYDYDGDNFFCSDAYFSDINNPFKLEKLPSGHYSKVYDDVDCAPVLHVGRIPAHQDSQIKTYFDKLLIYQLDPGLGNHSYLNTATLSKQYDLYSRFGLSSMIDNLEYISTTHLLIDSIGSERFETSVPIGNDVIQAMNESSLVCLQGHGIPCAIACSGKHKSSKEDRYIKANTDYDVKMWGFNKFEDSNSIMNLKNYGRPSVLYALSCSTTPFGNLHCGFGYPNLEYTMSEAYLFSGDYGGVAYIGYTCDCGIYPAYGSEILFGKSLKTNNNLAAALIESINNQNDSQERLSRHLIGDPDIDIWEGTPDSSNTKVSATPNQVVISGHSAESKVIVYDGADECMTYYTSRATPNIISLAQTNLASSKDFAVSVFESNKLPTVRLFAFNSTITNKNKTYFMREGEITKSSISEKYGFYISEGGVLNLFCTRYLNTDKSFNISTGGELNVRCFGEVHLYSDNIEAGGAMNVTARQTTLEQGFCVEKGGTLSIDCHRWK